MIGCFHEQVLCVSSKRFQIPELTSSYVSSKERLSLVTPIAVYFLYTLITLQCSSCTLRSDFCLFCPKPTLWWKRLLVTVDTQLCVCRPSCCIRMKKGFWFIDSSNSGKRITNVLLFLQEETSPRISRGLPLSLSSSWTLRHCSCGRSFSFLTSSYVFLHLSLLFPVWDRIWNSFNNAVVDSLLLSPSFLVLLFFFLFLRRVFLKILFFTPQDIANVRSENQWREHSLRNGVKTGQSLKEKQCNRKGNVRQNPLPSVVDVSQLSLSMSLRFVLSFSVWHLFSLVCAVCCFLWFLSLSLSLRAPWCVHRGEEDRKLRERERQEEDMRREDEKKCFVVILALRFGFVSSIPVQNLGRPWTKLEQILSRSRGGNVAIISVKETFLLERCLTLMSWVLWRTKTPFRT